MTHLDSPAAETAVFPKPMSDVIDALKRLERVGSENSKTTEKLIQAATQLSRLIVNQYAARKGETITVISRSKWDELTNDEEKLPDDFFDCNYRIRAGRLWNQYREEFVDDSRDAAFAFAGDVAKGLLDLIAGEIEKRKQESDSALATLERAVASAGSEAMKD